MENGCAVKMPLQKPGLLLGAALALSSALVLSSAWAWAQESPESLLPPGFDKPTARPKRPTTAPPANTAAGAPLISAMPVIAGENGPDAQSGNSQGAKTAKAPPSYNDLAALSPQEIDQLLGLKPKYDIPPAARRALLHVGVLASDEGGLPPMALAHQNGDLVRAALAGNTGIMVSRWGHILLRRALASRLDTPQGMLAADFAGLRASLLVRMGEGDAARALVQDVDGANYTPDLTQAAIDAYLATADITGMCPIVAIQGNARSDPQWKVLQAVCNVFSGASSMAPLDHLNKVHALQHVDMLLAQKYAGAAGKGRRNITLEWNRVSDLTPWRYAFAVGTGLTPPPGMMQTAGPHYSYLAATAPMLGLPNRAAAADWAGAGGVLSAAAMVDLYSQIYANSEVTGEWATRAGQLHDAYTGKDAAARLAAIKLLWGVDGVMSPSQRYSRQVLTAYAAARLPVTSAMASEAPDLITAMLAGGLDGNAARWTKVVDRGSLGWALLALANPESKPVDSSALSSFFGADNSSQSRKSGFLLAGLAGLGRVAPAASKEFATKLGVDIQTPTKWTGLIDRAAAINNPELVALLAGLGMQGSGWDKMTPRYLFHIVSALNRVGMGAEARMIAAEAVARA